jgi:flagellar biosynthesis component FlhA
MTTKKNENAMGQLIRICILGWSAALLTASYAGTLSKMDPTFIATVFTASAATFGINTMKKGGGDDEDEKKEEPKKEMVIEETPSVEPTWEDSSSDSTLEERVGALEAKVEGEEGEGFVQPRTGA